MASFYGEGSEEAAARFEADYFAGDEMFQLDVQPVKPAERRVVEPDPFLGFDPTRDPSRSQAPMLQPPSLGGKMPPSYGAVRRPLDIVAPAYKESLLRDDEALGEQQLGVWGRLGRSSSPNLISGVVEVGNGLFHENSVVCVILLGSSS